MNLEIPDYDIESEPLGSGAMATVYLAVQRSLGRRVALKVMKPELTTDPALCERFLREGRALAQITHAHVVTVFDARRVGNVYYIAMEYLAGGTLEKRIETGMQAEDAIRVLREIASALVPVHEAGIIHRDIKPANILFHTNGNAVLSDFGIVKVLDGRELTVAKFHPGTYEYMSPEQVCGQQLDHRSDLYSLGIVLHAMLTGDVPFRGSDPVSFAHMHCTEPVPRLAPTLAVYQELIDRLLAKEPQQRMPSAQAVLDYDLDEERKRLGLITGGTVHQSERKSVTEGNKSGHRRFRWLYIGVPLGLAVLGLSLSAIQMPELPVPPVVEPASPTASAPPAATTETPPPRPVPPLAEIAQPQPAPSPVPVGPAVAVVQLAPVPTPAVPVAPVAQPAPPAPVPDQPVDLQAKPDTDPTKSFVVFRDTMKDGTPGPEMVSLPGNSFQMGSPRTEVGSYNDEGSQHWVSVQPFAISRTEVSFADYDRFAASTGRKKPDDAGWGRGIRPAINVNWRDAKAYAQWLSQQTGKIYRLPTEAEWEYAARAGTTAAFWTGSCIDTNKANYDGTMNYAGCGAKAGKYRQRTVPVGSLPANSWGLREMAGNIWEWVEDCWHDNYRNAPADGAAWLNAAGGDCVRRVVRGGSWFNFPQDLRSANRNWYYDGEANLLVGIRLARTL